MSTYCSWLQLTVKSVVNWNGSDKQTSLHTMANDKWSIVTTETTKKYHHKWFQKLAATSTFIMLSHWNVDKAMQHVVDISTKRYIYNKPAILHRIRKYFCVTIWPRLLHNLQQKWSYNIISSSRRNVNKQQSDIMKLTSLNDHHLCFSLWCAIFSRAKTQRMQLVGDYTDYNTLKVK